MPLAHQASKSFTRSIVPSNKRYEGDLINSANTIRAIYSTTAQNLIRIGKILIHAQKLFKKNGHPNNDFRNWVNTEFASCFTYSSALNFINLAKLLDSHTRLNVDSIPLGALYLLGRKSTDRRIINLVERCPAPVSLKTIHNLILVQSKLDNAPEKVKAWLSQAKLSLKDLELIPSLLILPKEEQNVVLDKVSELTQLKDAINIVPKDNNYYQIERVDLSRLSDVTSNSHEVGICYLPTEYEEKSKDISLLDLFDRIIDITSQMLFIVMPTEMLSEIVLMMSTREEVEYFWAFTVKRPTLFDSERNIASQSLIVVAYKVKGSTSTPEYIQDTYTSLSDFFETIITKWYAPKCTLFVSFAPKPSERVFSLSKLKRLFIHSRLTLGI